MALRMYTSKELVPKGLEVIDRNDFYFDFYTIDIIDSDIGHKIIEIVEKGKYVNTKMFIGQFHEGAVYADCLSTGSKTLLNILGSDLDNKCFNTIECGNNALQFMLDFLDGNVIVSPSMLASIEDESREYYINGKRVYNDDQLTEELEYVKNK